MKCLKPVQSKRKGRTTAVKWLFTSDMVCLLFLCQLRDVTRAALPVLSEQPQHFHTLQSRRCRMWRPWTYTDPFQEQDVVESFKWVSVQHPQ